MSKITEKIALVFEIPYEWKHIMFIILCNSMFRTFMHVVLHNYSYGSLKIYVPCIYLLVTPWYAEPLCLGASALPIPLGKGNSPK
jgi:hypothetical protein